MVIRMPFGRRNDEKKDPKRGRGRDPFGHLEDERSEAESGDPWFLGPDDGPELDIETGISSNLTKDDLEES
jgi:hypothetical protein